MSASVIDRLYRERPRSRSLRVSVAVLGLLGVVAWCWAVSGVPELLGGTRLSGLERFLTEDVVPYSISRRELLPRGPRRVGVDHVANTGARGSARHAVDLGPRHSPRRCRGDPARVPRGADARGARSLRRRGRVDSPASRRVGHARRRRRCARGPRVRPRLPAARAARRQRLAGDPRARAAQRRNPRATRRGDRRESGPGPAARAARGGDRARRARRSSEPGRSRSDASSSTSSTASRPASWEATVLGMLGIVSLGASIQEARARGHYDEMLFLVVLGGGLVLAADLLSQLARGWIRRES